MGSCDVSEEAGYLGSASLAIAGSVNTEENSFRLEIADLRLQIEYARSRTRVNLKSAI